MVMKLYPIESQPPEVSTASVNNTNVTYVDVTTEPTTTLADITTSEAWTSTSNESIKGTVSPYVKEVPVRNHIILNFNYIIYKET